MKINLTLRLYSIIRDPKYPGRWVPGIRGFIERWRKSYSFL